MTPEVGSYIIVNPPQNVRVDKRGVDGLYRSNIIFRASVERMSRVLGENALNPEFGFSPVVFAIAGFDALVGATSLYPKAVTGLSIGENAALVQAGVIGVDEMMKVLGIRERLTARRDNRNGVMVAFRGISLVEDQIEGLRDLLISEASLRGLELVNINGDHQGVLSGEVEDVDKAIDALRGLSRSRFSTNGIVSAALLKNMPGPLHSSWMYVQERHFINELERSGVLGQISVPKFGRIYSAMLQDWLNTQDDIYTIISEQLTRPVDFRRACEEIRGRARFVVTFDPSKITPTILEENGVRNILHICDESSFKDAVNSLRAA